MCYETFGGVQRKAATFDCQILAAVTGQVTPRLWERLFGVDLTPLNWLNATATTAVVGKSILKKEGAS